LDGLVPPAVSLPGSTDTRGTATVFATAPCIAGRQRRLASACRRARACLSELVGGAAAHAYEQARTVTAGASEHAVATTVGTIFHDLAAIRAGHDRRRNAI